jgi:hypothetical protein
MSLLAECELAVSARMDFPLEHNSQAIPSSAQVVFMGETMLLARFGRLTSRSLRAGTKCIQGTLAFAGNRTCKTGM